MRRRYKSDIERGIAKIKLIGGLTSKMKLIFRQIETFHPSIHDHTIVQSTWMYMYD